jgi:hypothetical protein
MYLMPTSDDAKFRAKFWIDVVGHVLPRLLGAQLITMLVVLRRL